MPIVSTARGSARITPSFASLPDGTYAVWESRPHLLWGDSLFEWSDAGYKKRVARARGGEVEVLTPRAIVEILAAGYRPAIHSSAR